MQKKTLALVSSYDEFCGNASYTKALAQQLSEEFDVAVIPLNGNVLRNGPPKTAKIHIEEISQKLRQFDCVNFQFEAGLFGNTPDVIATRFFRLAKSCKNLVVTMHRFDFKKPYAGFSRFARAVKKRKILSWFADVRAVRINNAYASLYKKIAGFCKKREIPIIVHTKRDQEALQIHFGYQSVFSHPLCFYDSKYIENAKNTYGKQQFCKDHKLDPQKTYLGIFGFISKYKGYETAIQALNALPPTYHLLILGKQHPHSIAMNESVNAYIDSLIDLVISLDLTDRVSFISISSDEDFFKGLIGCDLNLVPYLEVNQGGSGIAALSLESGSNSIFSQNLAFLELEKYARSAFKMFSIGNYLELAQAIVSYDPLVYKDSLAQYHQKYNTRTNAAFYGGLLRREKNPEKAVDAVRKKHLGSLNHVAEQY